MSCSRWYDSRMNWSPMIQRSSKTLISPVKRKNEFFAILIQYGFMHWLNILKLSLPVPKFLNCADVQMETHIHINCMLCTKAVA